MDLETARWVLGAFLTRRRSSWDVCCRSARGKEGCMPPYSSAREKKGNVENNHACIMYKMS